MPKKILVIDDEAVIVETICTFLGNAGYETDPVYDGEEALKKIMADKYDLITMDIGMPGKDGLEVLRELRQMDAVKSNIPVIIISARLTHTDLFKGYKEGADYYLTKPFNRQKLVDIVNYIIGDLTPEEKERIEREI